MKLKQIAPNLRRYIMHGIRTAFSRSKKYSNILNYHRTTMPKFNKDGTFSKKPSVFYWCNSCGELHKRSGVQVDHIEPVVPLNKQEKDLTINEYARRTFILACQVLCKECHKEKSKKENNTRRYNIEKNL